MKRPEYYQYAIARTLCEFMIKSDQKRYVDFINGIKDGQTAEASLRSKYGVSVEQLVDAYGRSMGVNGLRP
jgi:hypothetical protein